MEREVIQLVPPPDPETGNKTPATPEALAELYAKYGLSRKDNDVIFHNLGGLGGNSLKLFADTLDPAENRFARITAANTDEQQLKSIIYCLNEPDAPRWLGDWMQQPLSRFRLIQLGEGGGGAGGNPEAITAPFEVAKPVFTEVSQGAAAAVLVTGLGGGTGTGAAPAVAKLMAEMGIETLAILVMPLSIEGEDRVSQAQQARLQVAEHACVLTIYNDELYSIARSTKDDRITKDVKGKALKEALLKVNDWAIVPLLEALKYLALKELSIINRDIEDFKALLRFGQEAYIGSVEWDEVAEGQPEFTVEKAVAELLGHKFQNLDIIPRIEKGMAVFVGDFEMMEWEKISETIKARIKGNDPDKSVSITPGVDAGPKRKIFFMGVTSEICGPRAARTSENRVAEMSRANAEAVEAECAVMTLQSFIGEELTSGIDIVADVGGMPRKTTVYVGPRLKKFHQWFQASNRQWPMAKRLWAFELMDEYLSQHHPSEKWKLMRPKDLQLTLEDSERPAQSSGVDYGIARQPEKESAPRKGLFGRFRK